MNNEWEYYNEDKKGDIEYLETILETPKIEEVIIFKNKIPITINHFGVEFKICFFTGYIKLTNKLTKNHMIQIEKEKGFVPIYYDDLITRLQFYCRYICNVFDEEGNEHIFSIYPVIVTNDIENEIEEFYFMANEKDMKEI